MAITHSHSVTSAHPCHRDAKTCVSLSLSPFLLQPVGELSTIHFMTLFYHPTRIVLAISNSKLSHSFRFSMATTDKALILGPNPPSRSHRFTGCRRHPRPRQ